MGFCTRAVPAILLWNNLAYESLKTTQLQDTYDKHRTQKQNQQDDMS